MFDFNSQADLSDLKKPTSNFKSDENCRKPVKKKNSKFNKFQQTLSLDKISKLAIILFPEACCQSDLYCGLETTRYIILGMFNYRIQF